MKPIVSIIMGSTSDMPVMKKAAEFFNEMEIPFEINALSAHRTPNLVESFATNAKKNGIKVIIAGGWSSAFAWSSGSFYISSSNWSSLQIFNFNRRLGLNIINFTNASRNTSGHCGFRRIS